MYKILITARIIRIGTDKSERLTETLTNNELDATLATIAAICEIRQRYPDHAITNLQISATLDFDNC